MSEVKYDPAECERLCREASKVAAKLERGQGVKAVTSDFLPTLTALADQLEAAGREVERLTAALPNWSHAEALQQRDAVLYSAVDAERRARDATTERDQLRAEVDQCNAKLRRLYNAMCAAMANWDHPDPGDRNLSDTTWERVGKAQQAAYSEMHAVFEASPGVLYVDAYRAARDKGGE